MNCVILQPSYIPWRGYFHQIHKADVFVFYDDVQYDNRGWRHRNRIKTPSGTKWLSIPVHHKGAQQSGLRICEARICWDSDWQKKHWQTITHSYAKAPYFKRYSDLFAHLYQRRYDFLSDWTIELTVQITRCLAGRIPEFIRSSSLGCEGAKSERLLSILCKLGASHYISGPSAADYIDQEAFDRVGITIEYMQYEYADYEQLYPPFDGNVSILDLLFMKGDETADYIWGARAGKLATAARSPFTDDPSNPSRVNGER